VIDVINKLRGAIVPPALSNWAARHSKYATKFHQVDTWSQAVSGSNGYSDPEIILRVDSATRSVISGNAAFERDGFLFAEPDTRWPILTGLLQAHARDGYLRVVDYGGALGSVYWQHRSHFAGLNVLWGVVEQENFVQYGRNLPSTEISFFTDLDLAISTIAPNVILFSSVLQYLADPFALLSRVIPETQATIILDRTPTSKSPTNIPVIQRVPAHIYAGSYPAWIISRTQLDSHLAPRDSQIVFAGIEPSTRTDKGLLVNWQGRLAIPARAL
jgi:putative methyltransferase (TIGR04325 family)